MARTVKVGVVGCGAIAQRRHLPEYQARADVEIVAVSGPNLQRTEEVREAFGVKYAFSSLSGMLSLEELDAVSICAPNQYHAELSIQALLAGKHVLCEKPMATSIAEAKSMIAAADRTGVYLMIAHNQRFMPLHLKAKAIIDSGALGRILTFSTTFGHGGPEDWSMSGSADSWFFDKEKAFVGAMGDLGVHKADLLGWLLSDPITEVQAMTGTLHKKIAVDDNALFLLRTRSGAIGTLTASWTYYPTEVNSTILNGELGRMLIGAHPDYSIVVEYKDGTKEYHETERMQTNGQGGQSHSGVIDHFIAGILDHTGHSISGREALRSLEIIFSGILSAESGSRIIVS